MHSFPPRGTAARSRARSRPRRRRRGGCHGCGRFQAEPIRGAIVDRVKATCSTCGRLEAHRDLYSAFLARFAGEGSSVDLHAASAAWTGAFGLLCGARRMYDKAEKPRPVRVFRATATSYSALVPHAQTGACATVSDVLTRCAPTTVRDGSERGTGRSDSSGGGAPSRVLDRSNQQRRAPLPLEPSLPGILEVRAGPRRRRSDDLGPMVVKGLLGTAYVCRRGSSHRRFGTDGGESRPLPPRGRTGPRLSRSTLSP